MKDKVLQFVNLITEEAAPDNPAKESDVSLTDLLRRKERRLSEIGIIESLRQWDQQSAEGGIAVALRRRTHHHHRISGLRYNKDVLNLGFIEIAKQSPFQDFLTDVGKERIRSMEEESSKRFIADAERKSQDTLLQIENNIDAISKSIVAYYKLPFILEDIKRILVDHTLVSTSFDLKNECTIDKLPELHKRKLDQFIAKVARNWSDFVDCVYLVGSLGRGEFEEGHSDVNVFVVFRDSAKHGLMEDILSLIPYGDELSLRVWSKKDFHAETNKKWRFIVFSDGLLLFGQDLIGNEEFPKPGMLVALLLNDDMPKNLQEAEEWARSNPAATPLQISAHSKQLAKRLIDFVYGVVIANKPEFTSSREERINSILEMYPQNKRMVDTLRRVSKYGVGDFESFHILIEGFRPKVERNLAKMQQVRASIDKQEPTPK
jgi:predicted nucleotidyltransferase